MSFTALFSFFIGSNFSMTENFNKRILLDLRSKKFQSTFALVCLS